MTRKWSLGAVGDVYINRQNPDDAFTHSADLLASVDMLFGNSEGAYTDKPSPPPGSGWVVCSSLSNLKGLKAPGFDVMSCANNHIVDGGYDGLDHTLSGLKNLGIRAIGVGKNVSEARKPAILEQGDVKVGFLARSCVHPPAYAAKANNPGLAAIRVVQDYRMPNDGYSYVEPGSVPEVWTTPRREDLDQLEADIQELKGKSDIVVASFHWGTARYPIVLLDYERELAKKAIDFGADIVYGHHHHFLRGIEFYNGKPIFYGLGHFVFDLDTNGMWTDEEVATLKAMGEYAIYPREGYPLLPFHPEARLTLFAVIEFDGANIDKVGIVPCIITPENHAVPLSLDSPDGKKIVDYMQDITTKAGLSSKFSTDAAIKVGNWSAAVVKAV
ncbi:MAG: CapA family protein [Rhizobiaceae bacterium]|nr:CapA family protein [Rhizobiaceae bacterium]